MCPETRALAEAWWHKVFGHTEEAGALWRDVTVSHPHALLDDYAGWYVAWRDAGVHVSAPSSALAEEVTSLQEAAGTDLQDPAFWRAFARQRGLELRGPSVHHLLDQHVAPDAEARPIGVEELDGLRAQVSPEEWDESGLSHADLVRFGLVEDGRLVAAAGLDDWAGSPRDIGVLVVPDRRGRGLAIRVGRSAASYAVRRHQLARWRATTTNTASLRTAARLGFEPYCTQLALRPPG